MNNFIEYFAEIRQQYINFRQGKPVRRKPLAVDEKFYAFATPIFVNKDEDPIFIPFPIILKKLLDRAEKYPITIGPAALLGINRISLSLMDLRAKSDPCRPGIILGERNTEGYFRCGTHPIPDYHNYENPQDYSWDFYMDGEEEEGVIFSLYQPEYLIYCMAKYQTTYQLFMDDIVKNITKVCEYDDKEKAKLEEEFLQLHLYLNPNKKENETLH